MDPGLVDLVLQAVDLYLEPLDLNLGLVDLVQCSGLVFEPVDLVL